MNKCIACNKEITGCKEICTNSKCARKYREYINELYKITPESYTEYNIRRKMLIKKYDMKGLK